MNRAWIACAAASTLAATGCASQVDLHLRALTCLNPPDYHCYEDGRNSLLLEFWVYQLKEYVDPSELSWDELTNGDDFALLGPYLTDPERTTIVKLRDSIQRTEERRLTVRRLKGTSHLLIVTNGRHEGDRSIVIVELGRFQRQQAVELEEYDIRVLSQSETRLQLKGGERSE